MDTSAADLAHTLTGAYAMDAVSDADRAAVDRHLTECGECRDEVRGLRETTARLAVAAALAPRAKLKASTIRAASQIRQLPPVLGETERPAGPREAAGQETSPWAARRAAASETAAPASRGAAAHRAFGAPRPAASARGLRRRPRGPLAAGLLTRLAGSAAAALAVVALVLAVGMHSARSHLAQAQRATAAVASVLGAPDAATLTAKVSSGGSATVVMSHAEDKLVLTGAALRPLPAAERYEVWLMGPAGERPQGTLPAARAGMTGPMVVSGLRAGDRIGVTVEPAAGPPDPASAPVLMLSLR